MLSACKPPITCHNHSPRNEAINLSGTVKSPTTQGRGHHGFNRFQLVRGIGAEIDFRRLHIRVAQPERDFAEVPRGLQDHHGTGVTQHMRGDLLLPEGGTAWAARRTYLRST